MNDLPQETRRAIEALLRAPDDAPSVLHALALAAERTQTLLHAEHLSAGREDCTPAETAWMVCARAIRANGQSVAALLALLPDRIRRS